MSWSIHATGTRAAVIRRVKDSKLWDGAGKLEVEQLEAAKATILGQIERSTHDAVEAGASAGFKVEASGHAGDSTNNLNVNVSQVQLWL